MPRMHAVAHSILLAAATAACSGTRPLADGRLSVEIALAELSPSLVPSSGGIEVTLSGKNLPPDAELLIGGERPPGLAWRDATRMTFVAPALAVGRHDVVLRAGGKDLVSARALRVYASAIALAEESVPWAKLGEPFYSRQEVRWRVGDINGDHLDDVAFWSYDGQGTNLGRTLVFLANGTGSARPLSSWDHQPWPVALLDVDGDGRDDLIDGQSLRPSTGSGFADALALVGGGEHVGAAGMAQDLGSRALVYVAAKEDGTGRLVRAIVSGGALAQTTVRDLPFAGRLFGYEVHSLEVPDPWAVIDFDGDGSDDLAYLAADRLVILKGPDFAADWEVPGDFHALQGHRTDVDDDGREEVVLVEGLLATTLTVVSCDAAGTPQLARYDNVCGLGSAIRGFAPSPEGVEPKAIGLQCLKEFLKLGWTKVPAAQLAVTERLPRPTDAKRVAGTGGTIAYDTAEQVLPRFARLEASQPAGLLLLETESAGSFTGSISSQFYDPHSGYFAGVPAFSTGEVVSPSLVSSIEWQSSLAGKRLVGYAKGVITARGSDDRAPVTLDLKLAADEEVVGTTHCDLDGDGVEDLAVAVAANGWAREIQTILFKPDGLHLVESFAMPNVYLEERNRNFALRALDTSGDGRCGFLVSMNQGWSGERESFWIHDSDGWHERPLEGKLPYAGKGYPLGHEQFADLDGDGDDDIILWEANALAMWIGENREAKAISWRKLSLPQELAGAYAPDLAFHDGKIWISLQHPWAPRWGRFAAGRIQGQDFMLEAVTDEAAYGGERLLFADVDGDGVDDLITGSAELVQVVRIVPGGGMEAPVGLTLAHPNAFSAAVDLDGDGLADLASLTTDGRILWARNRSK